MCSKLKYTTCYYKYIPKVLINYYNFQNDIGITCFLIVCVVGFSEPIYFAYVTHSHQDNYICYLKQLPFTKLMWLILHRRIRCLQWRSQK